jgi:autotransporter-associated beta strand protein
MELAMPGSDFFLNGRMSLGSNNATIGALNGTGTIFANEGTREIRVGGNDASGSYSGTLVNSSGSSGVSLGLVKTGTGVQGLLGGSSFSGGTRITAGQISVANGSALGSGAVDLGTPETGTNEVLLLQTVPINIANVINVTPNGTGGSTLGTANLTAGTANAIFSGQINLARNLTLRAGSNNRTTVSGRITGTGDLLISSPYYPGRRIVLERIFGEATDFQGEVEIQSGAVLQIGATNSIADRVLPNTATVRFSPGAQLRLAAAGSGDSETVGSLQSLASGAGTVTLISGSSFTLGTVGEGGTATFSGGVHNTAGSLSLSKTGAGVQILAGSNSFAGTLSINAGILVAAHRYALGTTNGATVVSAGGSLALSNDISIAAEPITLSGSGAGELGALRNLSGSNAYNGNVTLTGPATIACDSGSLWVGGNWSTAGHPITLKSDMGLIFVAKGIGGTGDLQKTGPGTAMLLGTNTYLGDTLISEGVLVLGNGAGIGSAKVVIQSSGVIDVLSLDGGWKMTSSQTLSGDGIVRGGVAVAGTLAPGASVGTLRVEGDCQLGGTTVMELDKTSLLQSNDLFVCTGGLTMGGMLVVTNVGAEPLALGDTFRLFSPGSVIPGQFAALVLPALSPDLNWDLSLLPTEGRITIIPAAVLPQPSLALVSTIGAITLSWSETFSDFVLQGQTNASAGLSTNWYPVEGVTNNSITLPLDPALGSVLFRLSKP